MGKNKKPSRSQEPNGRQPRSDLHNKIQIESVFDQMPVWRFKNLDLEHEHWGWNNFTGDIVPEIFKKLKEYESMKWKEIFKDKKRNHSVSIDQLVKAAQNRLQELRHDDIDELFRLRFTGTQRIWGILEGHIFNILWWDPDHTVYPSEKKNT